MARKPRRQADINVSETDVLLRLVPEQLPLIVYIYSLRERRNIYINQYFFELLGYPTAESQRVNSPLLQKIVHPDDVAVLRSTVQRYAAAADGDVIETTYRMRTSQGEWKWLRSRDIVLARAENASPLLILGTAEDVSVQVANQQRAEQHRGEVESERLRLLRLLDLNERERRMMAYDIHDGFIQDVVSAQLGIDALLDRLASADPSLVPPVLRVRAFIRKAIDEGRRVVGELRPSTTEDSSLIEAIQFLGHEAANAHGLTVKFNYPDQLPALSPLLVRSLARIVQEALNNVNRHAGVRKATIRLKATRAHLQLKVEDRGRGFDPKQVEPGHYGLDGMRERAQLCQGSLELRSRQGHGTSITVTVPLEHEPGR